MKPETSDYPLHELDIRRSVGEDKREWYIAICKCGWESDPKLSEFGAMDCAANHVDKI